MTSNAKISACTCTGDEETGPTGDCEYCQEKAVERKCPKCQKELWGCEYSYTSPERYDGVSEWFCPKHALGCGYRMGRWSGKELKEGEVEARFGKEEPYVPDECACGNLKNPKYQVCFTCYDSDRY